MISIAIDAAGGTDRLREVVAGAARASLDPSEGMEIQLVGDERRITELLMRSRHNPERVSVLHSSAEHPVRDAVRLAADVPRGFADLSAQAARHAVA